MNKKELVKELRRLLARRKELKAQVTSDDYVPHGWNTEWERTENAILDITPKLLDVMDS